MQTHPNYKNNTPQRANYTDVHVYACKYSSGFLIFGAMCSTITEVLIIDSKVSCKNVHVTHSLTTLAMKASFHPKDPTSNPKFCF